MRTEFEVSELKREVLLMRQDLEKKIPTLRDQFAMAAISGLLSCMPDSTGDNWYAEWNQSNRVALADNAYLIADEMMERRSREK